jgi:ribosomal protein S18 acetylase RimI-like enzyme
MSVGVDKPGALTIAKPVEAYWPRWEALYAGYAEFYRVQQTPEMRERVWTWINDPHHELEGFLALGSDGVAVGLAHFRPFTRPLSASTGGFIDDLFVEQSGRGSGVVDSLVQAVVDEGRVRGWSVVRWITAENNYRARAAYDRFAVKTPWLTYEIALG